MAFQPMGAQPGQGGVIVDGPSRMIGTPSGALRTYPHSTARQLLPEELPWDRHALDVFVLL
jgi:hypothetical protein